MRTATCIDERSSDLACPPRKDASSSCWTLYQGGVGFQKGVILRGTCLPGSADEVLLRVCESLLVDGQTQGVEQAPETMC